LATTDDALCRAPHPDVIRFLVHRLLLALVTLWLLSLITFGMGALAPGGPAEVLLSQHADPQAVARLEREFGLDRPFPVRYGRWLAGVVRGDFGISFRDRQPVGPTLAERYPVTARLGLLAALLALLAGLPLGLTAALRPGTWVDRLATTVALTGVSVPAFVVLPLLVLLFSLRLKWFPVTYEGEWWHLLLPAAALACRPAAMVARMTRASFLETLAQDYIRTARAKGLGWARTVVRHAGKNAALPVLTVLGTSVGYLLGGSFVVEVLFAVPGIGHLSIDAINGRDYPLVQAVVLLAAAVFILVNLAVDVLYGLLDPRLRVGGRGDE
jgi:ABC-type dipeptide/oligopeptide/nickel transport system permease component